MSDSSGAGEQLSESVGTELGSFKEQQIGSTTNSSL